MFCQYFFVAWISLLSCLPHRNFYLPMQCGVQQIYEKQNQTVSTKTERVVERQKKSKMKLKSQFFIFLVSQIRHICEHFKLQRHRTTKHCEQQVNASRSFGVSLASCSRCCLLHSRVNNRARTLLPHSSCSCPCPWHSILTQMHTHR